jgi:hypothetical protein
MVGWRTRFNLASLTAIKGWYLESASVCRWGPSLVGMSVGSGVFVGVSVGTGSVIAKLASSLVTLRFGRGKTLGSLAAHVRQDSRVHQPTAAHGRGTSATVMGLVTLPNLAAALTMLWGIWQQNGSTSRKTARFGRPNTSVVMPQFRIRPTAHGCLT